jgi:flagellar basal-body rod protein FlgF/flagellar basal-body rod protein FlgG
MDSGYYAACAGLSARMKSLELVANNLANLNTTGYRAQETTFRSLLSGSGRIQVNPLNRAINDYGVLTGTRLDLSSGNLETTGNPLDLGLEGSGFFLVQRQGESVYTRNGSFQVSSQGQLVTAQGDLVLGEQGPVAMPNGAVSVSPDGTISVDGAVAGKIRLADFPADASLEAIGDSYYRAPQGAVASESSASIRQGSLESSNVGAVAATVGLIAIQRHAEMLQNAMNTFYTEFDRIAANDLPRL